jgi:hypothetical protein
MPTMLMADLDDVIESVAGIAKPAAALAVAAGIAYFVLGQGAGEAEEEEEEEVVVKQKKGKQAKEEPYLSTPASRAYTNPVPLMKVKDKSGPKVTEKLVTPTARQYTSPIKRVPNEGDTDQPDVNSLEYKSKGPPKYLIADIDTSVSKAFQEPGAREPPPIVEAIKESPITEKIVEKLPFADVLANIFKR